MYPFLFWVPCQSPSNSELWCSTLSFCFFPNPGLGLVFVLMDTLSVDFDRAENRCYSLRCVWQLVSYIWRFSLHLKEVPLGDRAGGGGNVVPAYILSPRAVQWGGQGLPVRDGTGVTCKKYFQCQICSGDKTTTTKRQKPTTVVRGFYSLYVRDTSWNARVGVLRPNSIQFNQLHLQTLISFKSSKQSLEGMYP